MALISRLRDLFRTRPDNPFANPGVWYEGGDGGTPTNAIVVRGAESDIAGTAATFAWIVDRFGPNGSGWQLLSHSSGRMGEQHIDTFAIGLPDGSQLEVYFDVSESFGRPFQSRRTRDAP